MTTKDQIKAALDVLMAIAEIIRAKGSIPSGHLYALVMSGGMSLDAYQSTIATLKKAGLVSETGHVLTWTGPAMGSS